MVKDTKTFGAFILRYFQLASEQVAGHTQQDLTYLRMDRASGSIAHPPYFDGNNYGAWKAKMKSFLWSLDERVWSTVVHGFPKPTKKIGKGDEETTILKTREEWTTAEVIHKGTDTVKGAKLQMHTLQFETLMMDENETFSEFYAKLCVIVNACSSLGEKIPEDRVVKKILRSLPQRFQPKITAIEEIRDLNTLKVQELIGSIQTYEMKHLAPKKSKTVAFKVVNEEHDGHSNEDYSDEELTILTRLFMNFLKNQDPRSRDSKGINSKNRFVNYTDGYGHISSECANTLKKQKDGKNKAMHTTWSDSRLPQSHLISLPLPLLSFRGFSVCYSVFCSVTSPWSPHGAVIVSLALPTDDIGSSDTIKVNNQVTLHCSDAHCTSGGFSIEQHALLKSLICIPLSDACTSSSHLGSS
ncbi:hypothetical protein L3X38_042145 [Prunus dulcis]|uniref:DUF4219 domain-containing protein n=1 Tax=Prunus dulcis TaxID=3755 RepID=A0AAD4UVQ9_PRUDU|nr:hypothetical protein L3X38_042145 [Prunus dulcis]